MPHDTDDSADWNTRYRPQRFEDVFGQSKAAAFIGGLVAADKQRGHLLLYGDVGSGKTSLARIYARALNCRAPDPTTGSPCLACDHCNGQDGNLSEYDVPLNGGGAAAVAQYLRSHADRGKSGFPHVVFFDEAHSLSKKAAEYLLKRLEDAPTCPEPSAYVFATTEPERLAPALKSRLKQLHVSELSLPLAYKLLETIADQERIHVEAGAFDLVVRYAGRQPRDLISALQVATDHTARTLRVRDAKEVFGYDQVDDLEDYFLALARGDLPQLARIFDNWRLPALDKIDWIEAYITSFYLRTIKGLDVAVDPVIDSLVAQRREVSAAFLHRFSLRHLGELAPIWRAMMQFWAEPASRSTDAALRVALFHDKSSRGDWIFVRPKATASSDEAPPVPSQTASFAADAEGYLTVNDVRAVVNGASFLVQRSGCYLNLLLKIVPQQREPGHAEESVRQIDAIADELAGLLAGHTASAARPMAAIRVAENTGDGPIGFLAVSVPPTPHPDDGDLSPTAAVDAWIVARPDVTAIKRPATRPATASKLHWHIVRHLLAGFADDPQPQSALRELLQLESERLPGLLRAGAVRFWGDTSPAIDIDHTGSMPHLVSKFDAQRFDELYSDWERLEYARWSLSRIGIEE